ncbi:MAG: AAA family ATPase [Syntrophobacterales bacterium]|nr:AAA family ATPase [Syntrophobacterales bacterium]
MYEAYFGLKENPFTLSPDPRYLYLSPRHREALNCLLYGIHEKKGFMALTGGIGTGKTTLCRFLLSELGDSVATALIFNPALSDLELLKTVNQEFGIKIGSGRGTKKRYIDALNAFLLANFSRGKNAVLIIDEAQNLPRETLEQVRMLSNLETASEKLLQIVLLGQPELQEMLSLPSLRQLNERITVRYDLKPLGRKDVRGYLEHRLAAASGNPDELFSPASYGYIYRASEGIPRRINAICDRALLVAYSRDKRTVDRRSVRAAIRDLGAGYLARTSGQQTRLRLEIAAALLLWTMLIIIGYFQWPWL